MTPATPGNARCATVASKDYATSVDGGATLTVLVPDDAKVTVNGLATRSTGSRRSFVTYGLKPGLSYQYFIRAQTVRNNQPHDETRSVILTAGQAATVVLYSDAASEQSMVAAR